MKKVVFCILLLGVMSDSFGQLVRRKDYDAAFALQAGGETGMLTVFRSPEFAVRPAFGLKMTFPCTRKWFVGSEINYSGLKYSAGGPRVTELMGYGARADLKSHFDLKQIQVPLYLKYMLNCNKASILFGFYGSYVFDGRLKITSQGETVSGFTDYGKLPRTWNAGLTVGYEHQIVKHLHVMLRLSAGAKEVVKDHRLWDKKLFPVQGCIMLSYDLLRIGDCGCD